MRTSLRAFALVAVLAAAALAVQAQGSQALAPGVTGLSGYLQYWFPAVWLVILISMFVTSLAFMAGKGFGMRELEVWGKEELYQAIASAVILGAFSGLIVVMDETARTFSSDILEAGYAMPAQFAGQLAAGEAAPSIVLHWKYDDNTIRWEKSGSRVTGASCPTACHFYIARAFLGSAFEKLYDHADAAVRMYADVSALDSTSISQGVVVLELVSLTIGVAPFGGNSIMYDTVETAFTVIVKALLFLKFQEMALLYIERGVVPIFMISGLVLRSIWFTRKLGGLMLAMAIGFYTILPFMYVLDWYTMDVSIASYDLSALEAITNEGLSGVGTGSGYLDKERTTMDIFKPEEFIFTEYRQDNSVEYYGILDIAARYAFIAFASPMINLIVWLGFVRALSGFIGGDVEIAGITRIL